MQDDERMRFADYVPTRGQALQRTAYLLTGDWALAEDLVQTALARCYPRWGRISRDDPDAYVRKVVVNTWSSWWRRKWRGETPSGELPERAAADPYAGVDERAALRTALAKLPRRQRAVVVLRFHEDLSEAQVAQLLDVSVGAVKSQASKGLQKLRADAVLAGLAAMARTGDE
jgi:RNA polymerase sigma-70 factor (sigma-E family)